MRIRHLVTASATALALGLAAPALAQNTNDNTNTNNTNTQNNSNASASATSNGSSDDDTTITEDNDSLTIGDIAGGDDDNEVYGDGSASRGGEVETYGDGSASRGGEVETYGDGSASRGGTADNDLNGSLNGNVLQDGDANANNGSTALDISDSGNDESENYGDGSASRGGIAANGNDLSENENYGDGSASRGGEVDNANNTVGGNVADRGGTNDSSDNSTNVALTTGDIDASSDSATDHSAQNGSSVTHDESSFTSVYVQVYGNTVATQEMTAVISNSGMSEELIDDTGGFTAGANSIDNGSFAAFSGMVALNIDSGVQNNSQAGNNVSGYGSVFIGSQ